MILTLLYWIVVRRLAFRRHSSSTKIFDKPLDFSFAACRLIINISSFKSGIAAHEHHWQV